VFDGPRVEWNGVEPEEKLKWRIYPD